MAAMVQRGEGARLAMEASEPVRVGRETLGQHLERDLAAELLVPRAVDLAHPPLADEGEDLVRPETSAGFERHGAVGVDRSGLYTAGRAATGPLH